MFLPIGLTHGSSVRGSDLWLPFPDPSFSCSSDERVHISPNDYTFTWNDSGRIQNRCCLEGCSDDLAVSEGVVHPGSLMGKLVSGFCGQRNEDRCPKFRLVLYDLLLTVSFRGVMDMPPLFL